MMRLSLLHEMRRNIAVPLSLLWLSVLLFVYTCPVMELQQRTVFAEFYADQPLRLILMLALILGIGNIGDRKERRFWRFLTVAFAFWFVGDIAFQPPPGSEPTVAYGLLEDAMFLAFYPIFLIALEQRPHQGIQAESRRCNHLLIAGIILFCVANFCYFLLTTALIDPESYLNTVPSYTYFVVLDLVVTLQLFLLSFSSRIKRWTILYGLLGLTMACWTFGDLLDLYGHAGYIDLPFGTLVDFIWFPAYYVMIGALWYRNRTAPAPVPGFAGACVITSATEGLNCGRKLLTYAGALPVIHLLMLATDWLSQSTIITRGTVALGFTLLLGGLAALQFFQERAEHAGGGTAISIVLNDEEIQEARKMEALGRLAGGVAHDFNNVLTALQGFSELIAESESDEERAELTGHIGKSVEKAADLTRQLLAFSRKQALKTQTMDLNGVLSDLEEMVRRIIGEDVDLAIEPGKDLWPMEGDHSQLTQVIMNLVVNARKAMPTGGRLLIRTANVKVRTRKDLPGAGAEKGDYVLLEVKDTGCGIDEALRSRVFEPFFSAGPRDTGTGLGLATVYGIVKQSGGQIILNSEPGEGATFSLFFPRSTGDVTTINSPAENPAAVESGGRETILLAEDEDNLRTVVGTYLRKRGYRVLEACNGQEALSIAGKSRVPIDLLLTDVVMPAMGGEELATRLSKTTPGLRVLCISGYLDDPSRLDFGKTSWEFIEKPFTYSVLSAKIREILDTDV